MLRNTFTRGGFSFADAKGVLLLTCLVGCASNLAATGGNPSRHKGYDLMLDTSACWLGGLWTDAEGRPAATRKDDVHQHCQQVLEQVYDRADKEHEEQLRALDPQTVREVAKKVAALAEESSDEASSREALPRLLTLEAEAAKEALYGRRAAERVKRDLADERQKDKLVQHEQDAAPALRASEAMQALLEADLGPLTHDARALGLMTALGRIESASGLPRHLEVYAVTGVYQLVFGVVPPTVSVEATERLEGGVWLSYLSSVAQAATHPVPLAIHDVSQRENLAWNGAAAGFAEKLHAEAEQLSFSATPQLRPIVGAIERRLTAQFQTAQREAEQARLRDLPPPRTKGCPPGVCKED